MSNAVFEISRQLIDRGHEVTVFTPNFDREEKHEEDHQVERLDPYFSYGNAAFLPTLGKKLKDFDLVHLHYPFFGTAGVVKRFKKKYPHIPLVVTYHMDNRAGGVKGLIFAFYAKYFLKDILRCADALIGSTFDFIKSSDAKLVYNEAPHKWHEIAFGVDTERFVPGKKSLSLIRSLDLNDSVPTVLFVGGMDSAHHFKGVKVLLRALRILSKEKIPFQAVFVGDGELKQEYERVVQAFFLKTTTRFVGRVSDEELPEYYRLADVFVLPSTSSAEAFGMVLLEAMSSGCATIGSDLPGVREITAKGGVVVPGGDEVELAHALADFFALSEKKRENIARKNREIILQEYSWERIGKQHEQLYHSVVEHKSNTSVSTELVNN